MESEYLTPDEYARLMKVHKYTVYAWLRAGRIEARKIGRSWRIPRSVVDNDVESLSVAERLSGKKPGDLLTLSDFAAAAELEPIDLYEAIRLGQVRVETRDGKHGIPFSEVDRVRAADTLEAVALRKVPLLGEVSCGIPTAEEENITGWVQVPEGSPAQYAITANGDSMASRINDGDRILILPFVGPNPRSPRKNTMVLALVDGDQTLKWFRKRGRKYRLEPENPDYEPIDIDDHVQVIGGVCGRLEHSAGMY